MNNSHNPKKPVYQNPDQQKNQGESESLPEPSFNMSYILEHAPGTILVTGPDGTIEFVNKRWLDISGYDSSEILDRKIYDFWDISGETVREIFETLNSGRMWEGEIPNRKKNEEIFWEQAAVSALPDENGEIFYFVKTGQDITEKKAKEEILRQTEEKLRQSEESYRKILECAPYSITIVRLSDLRFMQVNDSFCQRLGYSREEVIGFTPKQLNIYQYKADRRKVLSEFIRHGWLENMEIRNQTREGTVIVNLLSASRLRFNGQDCMLALTTDITEQKKAQKALAESEKRFRTIFESARDGIYLKDKNLRYTLVNQAMGRLFGLAPEAFIGKTDRELFEADEPDNPETEDAPVLRGRVVETEENRYVAGEQKTFQSIKVPMKGYNEEITGLCGFVRDQTEKKRLEAQLLQSQKMEAIGTLAGGISHDFNNLLQAILGYCQVLMQDKPEDSSDYEGLERIEQSVKQAVAFTRQLTAFTRKVDIELQPLDLNQAVREVKQLLKRTLPKKIDIDLRLAGSLFTVNADPGQLQQVLLNIGVNARDAMPGGGRLVIETANTYPEEDSHGSWVLLAVEDTGSGMSEEVREHIFEPFYTTKGADGTGLGLAMVYSIIENHGGRIYCQSQPGQETRFSIYLPAAKGPAAQKSETRPAPVEKGLGETILIIDDEAYLRDFIETMLTRNGYLAITAASGEEGIELYEKHGDNISGVILDLNMPGMGGRQCLAGLMDLNPEARVIVSTGDRSQFDPSDPVLQKAGEIVQKPFEIREMLGKIRKLLEV